ncbi:hypothetical protein SH139x_000692 [Planctomycetaceae bacterium SH139]
MFSLFSLPIPIVGRWLPGAGQETVGLDISEHELCMVCVARQGQRFVWTSRARIPFRQSLGANLAGLQQAIPRSIDGFRRPCVAVLPACSSVLRWLSGESKAAFQQSVRADLGSFLGPRDAIEACRWPIGTTGQQMIYCVSSPAAQGVAEIAQRAGYQCSRVDSRPHALARALTLDSLARQPAATTPAADDQQPTMILAWGLSDCLLLFTQPPAAGQLWRQPTLCRQLHGVNLHGVEAVAPRRAVDHRGRLLSRLINAAGEEILRTLKIAEGLAGVATSGPLVVCGPAATSEPVITRLADALGREVRPWRWSAERSTGLHPSINPGRANCDSRFAVALAAACGGVA